jgi:hypothetical protein
VNLGYFNAIDNDLNTCYSREIRNRAGRIIETFSLNPGLMNILTLDLEGNVYVMRSFQTYYIGRDWGYPTTRDGFLNDNNVRIRLHPGTTELVLGQVDKGTKIKILEETSHPETIGGKTANWYKIKTSGGIVGWLFGAFVDVKK